MSMFLSCTNNFVNDIWFVPYDDIFVWNLFVFEWYVGQSYPLWDTESHVLSICNVNVGHLNDNFAMDDDTYHKVLHALLESFWMKNRRAHLYVIRFLPCFIWFSMWPFIIHFWHFNMTNDEVVWHVHFPLAQFSL